MVMRIGVLALQGCVDRHRLHVEAAGAEFYAVKKAEEIAAVDGLILPGGESTTMLKLINIFSLKETLQQFFAHRPVWGICAGSILMARKVSNPEQESFDLLPIHVERNGYGRQLDSRICDVNGYAVSFIRAPVIAELDETVSVKAKDDDGNPVWVEQGPYMATTFHPELTFDAPSPMHLDFIAKVRESIEQKAA